MQMPAIPVSEAATQMLYDLARETGSTPQEVLDQAVKDYRKKLLRGSIIADTDQPRTTEQMARALDKASKPTSEDDVPLSVDPDDYPLF